MDLLSLISEIFTVGLQAWIIILLLRKKFASRFPWFTAFVCYGICEGLVRSAIYLSVGNGRLYFYLYWGTEPADIFLAICALAESFVQVFKPFVKLAWFRWIVWASIVVTLLFWLWQSYAHAPADAGWLMSLILQVDLTVIYVPVVLALLYFGLIKFFGVTMHQRQSGIILGLSIYALAEVLALVLRSLVGKNVVNFIGWMPPLGYIVAEGLWIRELLQADPTPDPRLLQLTPSEVNRELGRYIKKLQEIVRRLR